MIVGSRQSIFDIALQQCGTLEAAFEIAAMNDCSLTDDLTTGDDMAVPQASNDAVVKQYAVNNILPATGITQDEINDMMGTGEGIEFWAIEYDFIVS